MAVPRTRKRMDSSAMGVQARVDPRSASQVDTSLSARLSRRWRRLVPTVQAQSDRPPESHGARSAARLIRCRLLPASNVVPSPSGS